MIKYDGGLEFHGTKIDLISELTIIMKRMVAKGVLDRDDVDMVVKTVFTPMDEIHRQIEADFKNMSDADKLLFGILFPDTKLPFDDDDD